jgi:phosphatidylinositol glycan class U
MSTSALRLTAILVLGVAVRVVLHLAGFQEIFATSYEISTPVSSHKRVLEGLYLQSVGQSPYQGSVYNQPPLILMLIGYLLQFKQYYAVQLFYICLDVLNAVLLYKILQLHRPQQVRELEEEQVLREMSAGESSALQQQASKYTTLHLLPTLPELSAALYLLNPYTWMSTVALSPTLLFNSAVLLLLYAALAHRALLALLALALATYLVPHAFVLVAPVTVLLHLRLSTRVMFVLATLLAVTALLYATDTWSAERVLQSYGTSVLTSDLQPNIGLFWYYFTEIFTHFRAFFLFVFQYHLFVYFIPLTWRLKEHPELVYWALVAAMAIFKAYPSVADISLHVSMLPLFVHKLRELHYGFVIGCGFVYITVLAPIIWRMWIFTGTGNANFYYGLNLALAVLQILLVTDSLSAILKRDFLLRYVQKQK